MNIGIIDEGMRGKIDSRLSYSPSLEAAVNLILRDSAFAGDRGTPSFKFLKAARFLKDNAPHVFQIHEMGAVAKNGMDLWLWDLLDSNLINPLVVNLDRKLRTPSSVDAKQFSI
jgi:hypothetical protein